MRSRPVRGPSESSVILTALPPERRRASAEPALAGACCCCCCLHSIGGLLGAAVAPIWGVPPPRIVEPSDAWDEGFDVPRATAPAAPSDGYWPAPAGPAAPLMFWRTMFALGFFGTAVAVVSGTVEGWFLATILLLPGLQLVAAVVVALILGVSDRPDAGFELRRLGRIALGTVVGAGFGLLAMWLMSRASR